MRSTGKVAYIYNPSTEQAKAEDRKAETNLGYTANFRKEWREREREKVEGGINKLEDSMLQKRGYKLLKASGTIVHSRHRRRASGDAWGEPFGDTEDQSEASFTCQRKSRRYSRKSGRDNIREIPGVWLSQGLLAVINILNVKCNRKPFVELCRITLKA